MKKIITCLCLLLISMGLSQDDLPYFQGPYFQRQYSQLDLSQLASLKVTLTIRDIVQDISHETTADDSLFTFVSRKDITTETHQILLDVLQPLYAPGGDTAALWDWLETYFTPKALADEMEIYFSKDYYTEIRPDFAGLNTQDFADALTMFLTMSYLVSYHLDSTPPEHDLAVRDQVRSSLLKSQRYVSLSDEEKQQGALILLFFVSYMVGEYNRALDNDTCSSEDKTPGADIKLNCPEFTAVDLVSTFSESLAQIFGFRVRSIVLTDQGFEAR